MHHTTMSQLITTPDASDVDASIKPLQGLSAIACPLLWRLQCMNELQSSLLLKTGAFFGKHLMMNTPVHTNTLYSSSSSTRYMVSGIIIYTEYFVIYNTAVHSTAVVLLLKEPSRERRLKW